MQQAGILAVLLAAACLIFGVTQARAQQSEIAPPLHTDGHRMSTPRVMRSPDIGELVRVRRKGICGGRAGSRSAGEIVAQIRAIGVNSVRLPWANETLEHDPLPPAYAIAANPQFKGKHAMEIMDAVIAALARAHIMVILDNHVSRADWCCSETDDNGLWYNDEYPETSWLADWEKIAHRYRDQKWVVGADLRNELRNGAAWGGPDPKLDWHAAAERGGKAVLAANPRLLVMVEGPEYSTNFAGFDKLPVHAAH